MKKPILLSLAPLRALVLAAALFLLNVPSALAKFDPSFVWTTLETPHFLIHFHQGVEETAKKAAVIAEDVHGRLVPRIKWEPKDKTRLVLVDATDYANGSAFPIPYNWIVVLLTHPLGEPGAGLTTYDDWLRTVITHEYTHILQLDMVTAGPDTVQNILGRIYFPNMFQPLWMIEGLATYEETEQTSGGRGRSPGAEMILRMSVLEDSFPELGQASVFPDLWPGGQVPYLFGEAFTRHIADTYGREKLAEISTAYSGRSLPFLVTATGKRVLGKRYDDLWDEWVEVLRERYKKQAEDIRAKGLTVSRPLTRTGYLTIQPSLSPDGGKIAYTVTNADEFPGLFVMNADGSGARRAVENIFPLGASGASSAWSPDGTRIYYTKPDIERSVNAHNDLYWVDLAAGREHRLTKGLRARDPHISPDGKTVVFVMNRMGRTRLAAADLAEGRRKPLAMRDIVFLTEESENQFASPRYSPDGSKIAVSVWQPGGSTDIWVLDARGNKIAAIAGDRAYDHAPAWSRDGSYLFFSSDRTGVFNIFAWEAATGRLFQVTNVLGGATHPALSADGRTLAFSSYSSKGFDIHVMDLDPAAWSSAAPAIDRYPSVRYEDRPVETSERPYSPLSTIYPRFWLPWYGSSPASGGLYGAFTMGWDVLQLHRYNAMALYGPENSRKWYAVDYFYDGLYPTLHLRASDLDVTYSDLLSDRYGEKEYVERQKTFSGSIIIPFIKAARQHAAIIGYQWKETSPLTEFPPWPGYSGVVPAEGVQASGRFSYRFNSSRQYGRSISPEQGRTVELGVERFDTSLGSDAEFTKYTADWHEYINLPPQHQVLQARAFTGTSTGEAIPQGAYQLGGDSPGDITLSLDDRSIYLRGYPVNVLRGRKAVLGSLEYRFPVVELERGWNTKPFYYRRLHGALFLEAGNAWDETFHHGDLRRSMGAEARLDMTLAYYLPLTIRFVIARGLDEDGQSQAYIGLWVPLEL